MKTVENKDQVYSAGKSLNNPELLVSASDRIDNAVWDAVCAASKGAGEDVRELVVKAMEALAVVPEAVRKVPYGIMDEAVRSIKRVINYMLRDAGSPEEPEWNMSIIGSVTDYIEYLMGKMDLDVCHPYEAGDGLVCFLREDRCARCSAECAGSGA